MASKSEIKSRQSELKSSLLEKNLTLVDFYRDVTPIYEQESFIEKFGLLSESRVREDLKAIGYVYSKDNEAFISNTSYIGEEAESQIIRCLYFMNLYQPISIDLIPYDNDSENTICQLSYILLQYEDPKKREYSKYNIKNLLKNLKIYYEYVYHDSTLGELNIVTTEKYVKFEFLDTKYLNRLYDHLKKWKSKSKDQNPFVRRKVGRIR